MTTSAWGTELGQLRYKPWGEVRATSGSNPADYTFTGQYSNVSDFGLLFYNARWYDPALGRMAQADSVVPGGVQGLDRYAYVNNSPLNLTDPSGHFGKHNDDKSDYWNKRNQRKVGLLEQQWKDEEDGASASTGHGGFGTQEGPGAWGYGTSTIIGSSLTVAGGCLFGGTDYGTAGPAGFDAMPAGLIGAGVRSPVVRINGFDTGFWVVSGHIQDAIVPIQGSHGTVYNNGVALGGLDIQVSDVTWFNPQHNVGFGMSISEPGAFSLEGATSLDLGHGVRAEQSYGISMEPRWERPLAIGLTLALVEYGLPALPGLALALRGVQPGQPAIP